MDTEERILSDYAWLSGREMGPSDHCRILIDFEDLDQGLGLRFVPTGYEESNLDRAFKREL